jgi:nitroimidazol reductase NimA-like FMN-containing flavoprotein (pyridoxamine 5'-phosphate oxidase superfamily)
LADPNILALLHDLFASQRLAALATQEMGQPYLSLMACAVTPDLKTFILATDRYTRKYANLMVEPRVALLVDNRGNTPEDTQEAVAVTVLGTASEATPEERQEALRLFLLRHPHLEPFATQPTCAIITVRVSTYLVVQRFQEVQELRMD